MYKYILLYRVTGLTISVPTFSWLRSARMLKNFIGMKKMSLKVVLIHSFPNISISTPWSTKHNPACQQQEGIFYTTVFSLLLDPYVSIISNIYNPDENSSLASHTICDNMFSYPKSYHTFHCFGYVIILYIFSSCIWQLSTYFEDGKF